MRLHRLALALALALIVGGEASAQVYYPGGAYPYPIVARTHSAQVYYANYSTPVFSPIPSVYLAGGYGPYPTPGIMYQAGYTTYVAPPYPGTNLYSPYPVYSFGSGYGGWGYGRGWGGYYGWGW